jgi:predicted glycoside hydrolase/deacetylase ChbG (UPF0249 family)
VKLIINADDLGYTPAINQAIFDLYNRERVSSTSLLVNMPYNQDAIERLGACPDLDVGVHLNLTKGRPLLPLEQIPTLVGTSGGFWLTKEFYIRAATGRISLKEVEVELRTQIERSLDYGILPLHLDSHSHWHLLPHLRKLVKRLAKDYHIFGIRQTALRRTLIPSGLWLAMAARKNHPQSKFRISDYFFSLHHWLGSDGKPVKMLFSKQLRDLIAGPDITLELVTHPGAYHDPDFPPDTLLTHQRQWEYDFLLSPRFDEWLGSIGAEISSFKAL